MNIARGRPKVGQPISIAFTDAQLDFLRSKVKDGSLSAVVRRIVESARLKEGHKYPNKGEPACRHCQGKGKK